MVKYKPMDLSRIQNITIPSMSWVMGFTATDGCIWDAKSCYCLEYGIHQQDLDILKKIRKVLKVNDRLIRFRDIVDKRSGTVTPTCRLRVYGKDIYKAFQTWNIGERKSLDIKFPHDIPFMRDFLRGAFDGDGCISLYKTTTINKLFICGCSEEFIEGCKTEFDKLGIESKIEKKEEYQKGEPRKNPLYELQFSKSPDNVKILYNFLYEDAKYFSKRKKSIFDKYLKHC